MLTSKGLPTKSSKKRALAEDDEPEGVPIKPVRKKRAPRAAASSTRADVIDLTGEEANVIPTKKTKTKTPKSKVSEGTDPERRIRPFRKHPPKSYLDRLERATSQRCDTSFIA